LKFRPDGTINEIIAERAAFHANSRRSPEEQIRTGDRIIHINRVPGHYLLRARKDIAFVARLFWDRAGFNSGTNALPQSADVSEMWKSWPGQGHILGSTASRASSIGNVVSRNAQDAADERLAQAFELLRIHINCPGVSIKWWELHFGSVFADSFYGSQFWKGFLKLFRQYLGSYNLFSCLAEDFRLALFRKPVSRGVTSAVSRELSDTNAAMPESLLPCFATDFIVEFHFVVCIRIVLFGSSPVIVHRSWLIFL
jgi:hypothetical protein